MKAVQRFFAAVKQLGIFSMLSSYTVELKDSCLVEVGHKKSDGIGSILIYKGNSWNDFWPKSCSGMMFGFSPFG